MCIRDSLSAYVAEVHGEEETLARLDLEVAVAPESATSHGKLRQLKPFGRASRAGGLDGHTLLFAPPLPEEGEQWLQYRYPLGC